MFQFYYTLSFDVKMSSRYLLTLHFKFYGKHYRKNFWILWIDIQIVFIRIEHVTFDVWYRFSNYF